MSGRILCESGRRRGTEIRLHGKRNRGEPGIREEMSAKGEEVKGKEELTIP